MKFHTLHPTPVGSKCLPAGSSLSIPLRGRGYYPQCPIFAVLGLVSQGMMMTGSVKEELIAFSLFTFLSLRMHENDVRCLLL